MKTIHTLLTVYLCSIALPSFLGCSSGNNSAAQVQGTVTIEGELARKGTVTFHSQDGHPMSYGAILKDGTFALRVGQGNKGDPDYNDIPTGEYIATVSIQGESREDPNATPGAPPLTGPLLIDKKFTSKSTSGLKFKIKPGLNAISIELERPSPNMDEEESESNEEAESSTTDQSAEEDEELTETEEAVDKILTDAGSGKDEEADTEQEGLSPIEEKAQ